MWHAQNFCIFLYVFMCICFLILVWWYMGSDFIFSKQNAVGKGEKYFGITFKLTSNYCYCCCFIFSFGVTDNCCML